LISSKNACKEGTGSGRRTMVRKEKKERGKEGGREKGREYIKKRK
jgi:hypothetical protein